jgi:hypothetical protein
VTDSASCRTVEAADVHLLPRLELRFFLLLEAFPGEAEEDEHHAEVHDVAAVAPLVAPHEPDERREDSRCRWRAAAPRAPRQNSWPMVPTTNGAQRESRCPTSHTRTPEARAPPRPVASPERHRNQKRIAQVTTVDLRHASSGPMPGEQQQRQARSAASTD